MNLRPVIVSILIGISFAGCATFNDQELAQIRQRGVSPVVVGKLKKGDVLSPGDVIELSRRGVADDLIIRQIEDAGVDYVLTPNDLKTLEKARVNRPVVEALIAASDEFARDHSPARRAYGGYAYPYGPDYYGPYYGPYPYYYPYGGAEVIVGGGRYWGGHGHWH